MQALDATPLPNDISFIHLLESLPDGLLLVDGNGIIVKTNSRTAQIFGYSEDALMGQPVEKLIPENQRSAHASYRVDFARAPEVHVMGQGQPLTGLRADGTEFPIEVSLSPLQIKGGDLIIASIRDVSQWRKSEVQFRNLLDAAPDAMLVINQEGIIQFSNAQVEELLGYAGVELLGQSMEMLVPQSARGTHSDLRERYHQQPYVRPMGAGLDLYAVHKDGRDIPVEIGLSPMQTEDGMLIIAALRDFSKQKHLNDQLTVLSITDQLTGLLNRRGFHEVGGKLRAIARRNKAQLILVMVDINEFKGINDKFGHSVGDLYLQDMATVLQHSVREADVVARWGGDEFVVLVVDKNEKSPDILVRRIRENLVAHHKENERDYPLSISVGVATGDPDKDNFDKLLKAADQSMYQEKKDIPKS